MSTTPPDPPRADRTWLYVALAFLAFWGVYLRFFGPGRPGGAPQLKNSALPVPAEYAWRLSDLDGKPVEFAKFRGRTVFLNFWATWCGPCLEEMPSIARLARNPEVKDVAFVCVSTDESRDAVREFLKGKEADWPMTVLHATDAPPVFLTDGIPATFLIAPDGRVFASHVGSAEWDHPSVVALLKSPTPAR